MNYTPEDMSAIAMDTYEYCLQNLLVEMVSSKQSEKLTRMGFHIRLSHRIGVWVCHPVVGKNLIEFYRWKADALPAETERKAADISNLIRLWQPVIPIEWIITTPPQGASLYRGDGHYCAGMLATAVGALLGLEVLTLLTRTTDKRYHHPKQALTQGEFVVTKQSPSVVLVIDDLISSRTTMTFSLDALISAGIPAFGFAWGLSRRE